MTGHRIVVAGMRERLAWSIRECGRGLPVPVLAIAEGAGWQVEMWPDMGEMLGLVVQSGPVTLACISADESYEVQRYALAHEIGHVLLGHISVLSLCGAEGQVGGKFERWIDRRQEAEADAVAAELLVPDWALDDDVMGAAERCQVPTWLVNLRIDGCRAGKRFSPGCGMALPSGSW